MLVEYIIMMLIVKMINQHQPNSADHRDVRGSLEDTLRPASRHRSRCERRPRSGKLLGAAPVRASQIASSDGDGQNGKIGKM